jgi:hypothetical protein
MWSSTIPSFLTSSPINLFYQDDWFYVALALHTGWNHENKVVILGGLCLGFRISALVFQYTQHRFVFLWPYGPDLIAGSFSYAISCYDSLPQGHPHTFPITLSVIAIRILCLSLDGRSHLLQGKVMKTFICFVTAVSLALCV